MVVQQYPPLHRVPMDPEPLTASGTPWTFLMAWLGGQPGDPNSSSTSSLPAVLTGTRNLCSDAQGGSPPSRGQMETLIVDFYEADPKEL